MKGHVLVGHTGFVGSNLLRQRSFEHCVNRANLASLEGAQLQRLVLSALPAEKWRINLAPDADLANMRQLQRVLSTVRAAQVVLISTVDVFGAAINVDEGSPIVPSTATPYGQHRYEFERWVAQRFEHCTVLRLPGLFGTGLKKNALYDLLHQHEIERLHPEAQLQWYPIARLADDIDQALAGSLRLVHAAVEPVVLREIAQRHFPLQALRPCATSPARYDMRSRHASHFGGTSGYWMDAAAVLEAIGAWISMERAVAQQGAA